MANYAGQNLGANRIDRIKEGVLKSTYLTLIFSVISIVIVYTLAKPILMLFDIKDNTTPMKDALTYLKLTSLFYPALSLLFIHRNVLQGIGRSFMPLMAGVFELVARAIIAFVLPGLIGYAGVCLAGPAAWLAAAIPLAISYVVIIKQVEHQHQL